LLCDELSVAGNGLYSRKFPIIMYLGLNFQLIEENQVVQIKIRRQMKIKEYLIEKERINKEISKGKWKNELKTCKECKYDPVDYIHLHQLLLKEKPLEKKIDYIMKDHCRTRGGRITREEVSRISYGGLLVNMLRYYKSYALSLTKREMELSWFPVCELTQHKEEIK